MHFLLEVNHARHFVTVRPLLYGGGIFTACGAFEGPHLQGGESGNQHGETDKKTGAQQRRLYSGACRKAVEVPADG